MNKRKRGQSPFFYGVSQCLQTLLGKKGDCPLFLLACLIAGTTATAEENAKMELPEWADDIHTFIMIPTRPERAKELNVSVNGAWAGIPGAYQMLPHHPEIQEEYNHDQKAFADACHEAGLLVTASINGIEGFAPLREKIPNAEDMACRNVEGEPLVMGGGMMLMCTINPDWVQWEISLPHTLISAVE